MLIVTLCSINDKMEVLKLAASLCTTKWKNVYITPDLTLKEREKGRELRKELQRRKEKGEEHIWIRQGKIVPIPENKGSMAQISTKQQTQLTLSDAGICSSQSASSHNRIFRASAKHPQVIQQAVGPAQGEVPAGPSKDGLGKTKRERPNKIKTLYTNIDQSVNKRDDLSMLITHEEC